MTMLATCLRVSLMLLLRMRMLLLGTEVLLLKGSSILFFTSGRSSILMLLGTGPGPG